MNVEAPLVVDASVVVKWFVTEDETNVDEAALLLDEHASGNMRLVAPALLAHELFGVLMRGGRAAADTAAAIDAFFDADVGLVSPTRDLMRAAAVFVHDHGVSALDSAYAALAQALDCELATADRKLARAVAGIVRVREI